MAARGVWPLLLGASLIAALGLAGCGGNGDNGIATAGTPSPAGSGGPSPSANEDERARQYVACLRQHGVQVADPEKGKQVELNPDRPQDKQAAQACRQYLPTNAGTGPGDLGPLREYAACMRANGLPDFPDPDPEKGLTLPKSMLSDPKFREADAKCERVIKPGAKG